MRQENLSPQLETDSSCLFFDTFYLGLQKESKKTLNNDSSENKGGSPIPGMVFFHPDYTGNISFTTNKDAVVQTRMMYKPYGEVFAQTDGNWDKQGVNNFRYKYNSQQLDDTGLMYFKARFYDPAVGRFITADPTIPNPEKSQLFNRYMFVAGSPIQLMDEDGHSWYSSGSSNNDSGDSSNSSTENSSSDNTSETSSDSSGSSSSGTKGMADSVVNSGNKGNSSGKSSDGMSTVDKAEIAANVAGMVPGPLGVAGDIASAGIALYKGDYAGAGLSMLCALPVVGTASEIVRAGKAADKVVDAAKVADKANDLKKIAKTEEHHLVPYNNKYKFQDHDLVKEAGVDLKKYDNNLKTMVNHGGRHTYNYSDGVLEKLDNAAINGTGKGQANAQKYLDKAMNSIVGDINSGSLKPYKNKDVFIP